MCCSKKMGKSFEKTNKYNQKAKAKRFLRYLVNALRCQGLASSSTSGITLHTKQNTPSVSSAANLSTQLKSEQTSSSVLCATFNSYNQTIVPSNMKIQNLIWFYMRLMLYPIYMCTQIYAIYMRICACVHIWTCTCHVPYVSFIIGAFATTTVGTMTPLMKSKRRGMQSK